MKKIIVDTPVVEIDGDEMTKIIWELIRERLIKPYLDLETLYFDLSIENRDKTSVGEIVGYTTSLVSIIALIKSF